MIRKIDQTKDPMLEALKILFIIIFALLILALFLFHAHIAVQFTKTGKDFMDYARTVEDKNKPLKDNIKDWLNGKLVKQETPNP